MYKIINFLLFLKILNLICFCLGNSSENSLENLNSTKLLINQNEKSMKLSKILTKSINYGILSESEFKLFKKVIEKMDSSKCKTDLNLTLLGITSGQSWAIAMYDSSVKKPAGIEIGSVYQFGNFDECVNNDDNVGDISDNVEFKRNEIKPKYCLVDVTLENYNIQSIASRIYKKTNSTIIHWGICIPASCQTEDIKIFMSDLLDKNVELNDDKCYVNEPLEPTKGMIIYGIIIMFFVCVTAFSTIFHLYLIVSRKNLMKENHSDTETAIKAFSLIENFQKLFQKGNNDMRLNSINGIKSLLMLLIIIGHSVLFIVGGPVLNSDFFAREVKQIQNGFLTNSILFVDTFLLLSGFLFCRILLRELNRRHGKINPILLYIFRYIRLTPAYLAVIMFYITWFPAIGSGPLWKERIGLEQKRCETSWWLNLLYLNNYFGTENLCMFQSWYLSADTQLFMLAPVAIFLLYKNRKFGVGFLITLAVIATLLPFGITWKENLDPTILILEDEVSDISSNQFFLTSYIKTHMRATAYIFGLITGYILHYMSQKSIKIPKSLTIIFWILSTIIGSASMFSITWYYRNITTFNTFESSMYAGFHRLGWSLSASWLVIACTTGNAGFLEKILSSRFFAPLSRLTYCAYLTNGIVELYMASSIKTPLQMDHLHVFGESISHAVLTFLTSIMLCLLFESPIHAMERFFLKKDQQRRELDKSISKGDGASSSPSTSEDNV